MKKLSVILLVLFALALFGIAFADDGNRYYDLGLTDDDGNYSKKKDDYDYTPESETEKYNPASPTYKDPNGPMEWDSNRYFPEKRRMTSREKEADRKRRIDQAIYESRYGRNSACFIDSSQLDEYDEEFDSDCQESCLKMMEIVQENCAARIGKRWDSDECMAEGVEFFIKCDSDCNS